MLGSLALILQQKVRVIAMLVGMLPTGKPDLEVEVGVEIFTVCVVFEAIFC